MQFYMSTACFPIYVSLILCVGLMLSGLLRAIKQAAQCKITELSDTHKSHHFFHLSYGESFGGSTRVCSQAGLINCPGRVGSGCAQSNQ